MAWSLEKPLSIPLQYLFEKLLEILFLRAIALGFIAVEENPGVGLITTTLTINKLIKILNNLNIKLFIYIKLSQLNFLVL